MEIPYKHYHVEITATSDQLMEARRRILANGLAIDIFPFDVTKHKEACQAKGPGVRGQNLSELQGNL